MKPISWVVAGLLGAALVGCNGRVDVLESESGSGALQGAGASGAGAGGSQAGGGQAGESQEAGSAGSPQEGGQGGAPQGEGGQAGNPYSGGWAGSSYSGEMLSGEPPLGGLGLPAIALAGGGYLTCAVRQDSAIKCFDQSIAHDYSSNPFIAVGAGAPIAQVSVGWRHVCLLRADSAIQCWGVNMNGALGVGVAYDVYPGTEHADNPTPDGNPLPFIDLGPGAPIHKVSVGDGFSCALRLDGRVQCWGRNDLGQLGLGDTNDRGDEPGEMGASLPTVDVGPGARVVDIATDGSSTCILRQDGRVQCWGALLSNWVPEKGYWDRVRIGDDAGEMGTNLATIDLGSGSPAKQLLSGPASMACVIRQDDSVKCWGDNMYGQLGLGDSETRPPHSVTAMGDALAVLDLGSGGGVKQLSVGANMGVHVCALLHDGQLKCWGDCFAGALGDGACNPHHPPSGDEPTGVGNRGDQPGEMGASLPPVDLGAGTVVQQVAAGAHHTCVLVQDGSIKCWGSSFGVDLANPNRGDDPGEMGAAIPVIDLNF